MWDACWCVVLVPLSGLCVSVWWSLLWVEATLRCYFLSRVCCRYEFGNVWSPAAMDAYCGALFGRGSLLKCLAPPLLAWCFGLSAKSFVYGGCLPFSGLPLSVFVLLLCWGFVCLGEVLSPCPNCTPLLFHIGFSAGLIRLPLGSFLGLSWSLSPLCFSLDSCYGSQQFGWGSLPKCLGYWRSVLCCCSTSILSEECWMESVLIAT